MYQEDQIVGGHSGPETTAAGSRQGVLDTHGDAGPLTKPGVREYVAEAVGEGDRLSLEVSCPANSPWGGGTTSLGLPQRPLN